MANPQPPETGRWLNADLPLIAILRGVSPGEVCALGDVLLAAGFRIVEVPLNSPCPLAGIERLAGHLGDRLLVGAGTVTTPEQVADVAAAGGRLIVSPHGDPAVIEAAHRHGLAVMPGVFTATEIFAAVERGARLLKLFPAEAASPALVRALTTIAPKDCALLPVGGITPDSMAAYLDAGAAGFGLGGALYKPGCTATELHERAQRFAAAYRRWRDTRENESR
jgi:2-dehydro-3-deoxyphosphogalactonate aldolase